MSTEKIELKVEPVAGELVIRNGQAQVIRDPKIISIEGDIKTVSAFLAKRKEAGHGLQNVQLDRAVVLVDLEEGTIVLDIDPQNHFGGTVKASLIEAEELEIFTVNQPATYNREQLIKLLRFNKRLFDNPAKHEELLAAFQKFSVKAATDLAAETDTRGNKDFAFKKVVQTQIPTEFILHTPIYKGQPKERYRVEICLDLTDAGAKFWFESPELAELLQQRKEEIFAEELKSCDGFVVVNQ